MTTRALAEMGIHHFLVVEPQQADQYREAVRASGITTATVIELDVAYKTSYELCDDLGQTRSAGPGPARNFAWDHSIASGFAWHWVMDDNIRRFMRFNKNSQIKCVSPAFFTAQEDFVLRYKNIAMAGPQYFMFAIRKDKVPPFVINTRIYSCNLIRNDVPFRWRGRYNEDTIMSLDMLKAGWCTLQFNAFLQHKTPTQVLPGGNTSEFYLREGVRAHGDKYADTGTVEKSKMLCKVHPDVARMAFKFGRIHHEVNYRGFKDHVPIKMESVGAAAGCNEYEMRLQTRSSV